MKRADWMTQKKKPEPGRAGEIVRTALSLLAALLVYEAGKLIGMWLWQAVAGITGLGELLLNSEREGLCSGLQSFLMQTMSGVLCLVFWRQEISWRFHGKERRIAKTAVFILCAFFTCLGLNLLLYLLRLPQMSASFGETAEAQAMVPLLPGILLYAIAAPLSEEIMFRGILYGRARRVFSPAAGMVFASLIFGIYHGNPVQGIYAFLLGMLLCFVYERTGSLFAAAAFHGVGNLGVFLVMDVGNWGGLLTGGPGIMMGIFCVFFLLAAAGCFFLCFFSDRI